MGPVNIALCFKQLKNIKRALYVILEHCLKVVIHFHLGIRISQCEASSLCIELADRLHEAHIEEVPRVGPTQNCPRLIMLI